MTSPGASELTICLNPAGLERTLWWRESVVRHVDCSKYSHFRAVDLPSRAVLQPCPRRITTRHTARHTISGDCKAASPPGRVLRDAHSRIEDSACVNCAIAPWRACATCCAFLRGQVALPWSVRLGGEAGLQALRGVSWK